jgi:hypothetical protein
MYAGAARRGPGSHSIAQYGVGSGVWHQYGPAGMLGLYVDMAVPLESREYQVFCNSNIFSISDNHHPALPLEGGGFGWG